MEQIMRNFFLFLSKNKALTKIARKYGHRFGSTRFVAGETIEEAGRVIEELNRRNLSVTIDYLGEFVDNEKEANETVNKTLEAIKQIEQKNLNAQLSLKLTSMGLDISEEIVLKNMQKILRVAKSSGVFVTIDMEDYSRCQKTIHIYKTLRSSFDNVGTVIQAYLYRAENDIADLKKYRANLRLVKGAYKESSAVAFPEKKQVDENFKKMIKQHLLNGGYTAVATHDDTIIDYTKQLVKKYGISNDRFEFQMLYGIRPEKQEELAREGYVMRVYVPYGTDWFGYFMRRLAERPANVAFVLKGILKK